MSLSQRWHSEQIFLYRHPIDMRKQIDGLVAIVVSEMGRQPTDRSLYLFINKQRDKVKLLIWHINGFWMLYKRLDRQRFHWPDWSREKTITLTEQELDYLLDGYNLNGMRPHHSLQIAHSV